MPTNEEMAEATWKNEFPRLAQELEREKATGQPALGATRVAELLSAYVAGYLRAIKERE